MARTPPRQFRLGEDTLADLDTICTRLGLTSRAEAIRVAATTALRHLPDAEKKSRKKHRNGVDTVATGDYS